jgi:hypothetical protein
VQRQQRHTGASRACATSPAKLPARVVLLPPQGIPAPDHRAAEVHAASRPAKRRSAIAFASAVRDAAQWLRGDEYMTLTRLTARCAEESDQGVSRLRARCAWAGMVRPASAVYLACRDAGKPDLRSFGAPDGAVAIPNTRGGAGEGGAARYRGEERYCKHDTLLSHVTSREKRRPDVMRLTLVGAMKPPVPRSLLTGG